MENVINVGGRDWGKTAASYSKMIDDKSYPASVNSFQQNEINILWDKGNRMAAIKKLQDLLEPKRVGKTLL